MTTHIGELGALRTIERQAPPRLSDVLFRTTVRDFTSLAALPSNFQAVESALLFAKGLHPFVALVGPSGWGKSHLLEAVSNRLGLESGHRPEVISAVEWASGSPHADRSSALLLDNVQDALDRPKVRQHLRLALERRVKAGRPTMLSFTAAKPSRQLRALLPCPRDWQIATLQAPTPCERLLVIGEISETEGITINQGLARLLAHKMKGNGRTLVGALKRLHLYGVQWLDARATLKAVGILDPFFVDNSGWDLKEQIFKASQHPEFHDTEPSPTDLAIFTMLREACLSEASVAQFMQVEPSEAYLRATRFEEKATNSDAMRARLNAFVEAVVDNLMRD